MDVRFKAPSLERLEAEADDGNYPPGVAKAFRRRMQVIRAAPDERVLYKWGSLQFEKLKGKRAGQHSIRLNNQWRLIVEFEGDGPDKALVIVEIEDYH